MTLPASHVISKILPSYTWLRDARSLESNIHRYSVTQELVTRPSHLLQRCQVQKVESTVHLILCSKYSDTGFILANTGMLFTPDRAVIGDPERVKDLSDVTVG